MTDRTVLRGSIGPTHGSSMRNEHSSPITAALVFRAGRGADSAQVAEAVVALLEQLDATLQVVIGRRGVAALVARSVHLSVPSWPWLDDAVQGPQKADLPTLRLLLAKRTGSDAMAAAGALLQTICDLLADLIGPSLSARLLGSVWQIPPAGPPSKDRSP